MSGTDAPDDRARWNARHAARIADPAVVDTPSALLVEQESLLPTTGRALDVAGGTGRNAVWLAGRGLTTTLVDVSDTACAEATRRAIAVGVALDVERRDLTVDPVPDGPWDVIVVLHWLDRAVWRQLPDHLAPGGLLFAAQATVTNLERHERPGRRWSLEVGELADLAAEVVSADRGLEIVDVVEGWTREDRHEARLVLRRRA